MSPLVLSAVQAGKPDPAVVAPGLGAFLAFFALALICVVLGFSLTRRVRRSQRRWAELEAEEGAQQAANGPGPESGGSETGSADDNDSAQNHSSGDEPSAPPAREV